MLFVLDDERELLSDMEQFHQLDELVFNKLAEKTDFRNGQIGFNSAISIARIGSELTEHIKTKAAGKRVKVSRDQVIRSINRMVNAGLLERCSEDKKLMLVRVFLRDFLHVVKSAQNQDTTKTPQRPPVKIPQDIKILSYIFKDLHDFKTSRHRTRSHTDINQDTTHNNTYIHTSDADNKFKMTYHWKPDEEKFKECLALSMVKPEQIQIDWFAEYVRYWTSRTDIVKTESEWLNHYVSAVVPYVRNPQLFNDRNGYQKGSPGKKATVSKIDGYIPRVPFEDDQLNRYAKKHGFTYPCPTNVQSYHGYRQLLNTERTRRMDQAASKNERVKHG